jgi:hypothetical protein
MKGSWRTGRRWSGLKMVGGRQKTQRPEDGRRQPENRKT